MDLGQNSQDCIAAFPLRVLLGFGRAFGAALGSLPCGNGGTWRGETEAGVDHGNIQIWKNLGMREESAPPRQLGGDLHPGFGTSGNFWGMGWEIGREAFPEHSPARESPMPKVLPGNSPFPTAPHE